jgi:iron complex outermembrane receptor protein
MPSLARAPHGALLAALLPATALAQPPEPTTTLPEMQVIGQAPGSLTVPPVAEQRRQVEQAPAAVRFIESDAFRDRRAFTLRDVLAETPRVFVQERYGQELRLSLRGSGIARGFHLRGVELLQDGVPVNLADGSGDFYQIDPLAIRSVAVFPGGNALAHGASTLGGAVNVVTPTARTAEAANILRAEAGSFGTWRLSGQASRLLGDWDMLATYSHSGTDGWRRHSRGSYDQFNANLGYRISENVETCFYAGAYVTRQLLPGALSLSDTLNNPRRANPAAVAQNQARNVWAERFANRTTVRLDAGQIEVDSWVIHKRLTHPIFQMIEQDGLTWGLAPRWSHFFMVGPHRNDLVVGLRYVAGTNDADQYVNLRGSRGRQTLASVQRARNYEAYLENRLWVLPSLALVAGAKALRAERDYEDLGRGLASSRGAASLGRSHDGINPKIGLLWEPRPALQFFTNLTRSQDVPDFSDLAQMQTGSTLLVPLQAQRAWTAELGSRGRMGRLAWDLTLFRSSINGQLLQFTTGPGAPASTFNAGTTVNQGVELALRADLARGLLAAEDRLTLGQVWTFNDFRFRGDQRYGGNRIAGLPPHVLRTTLTYAQEGRFFLGPRWTGCRREPGRTMPTRCAPMPTRSSAWRPGSWSGRASPSSSMRGT